MTVTVCKHTHVQCERAEFCMMRRFAPEDTVHVRYIYPSPTGDRCPHFVPAPRDRDEAR